ncbi:hypothetical protein ACTXT7_016661 [Hymenolepis weldensis]
MAGSCSKVQISPSAPWIAANACQRPFHRLLPHQLLHIVYLSYRNGLHLSVAASSSSLRMAASRKWSEFASLLPDALKSGIQWLTAVNQWRVSGPLQLQPHQLHAPYISKMERLVQTHLFTPLALTLSFFPSSFEFFSLALLLSNHHVVPLGFWSHYLRKAVVSFHEVD